MDDFAELAVAGSPARRHDLSSSAGPWPRPSASALPTQSCWAAPSTGSALIISVRVLTSGAFYSVVWTTVKFVLVSVERRIRHRLGWQPCCWISQFVGRNLLRALMILPWALPYRRECHHVAPDLQPRFRRLSMPCWTQFGLDRRLSLPGWASRASALYAICLADVWKNFPLVTLIAPRGIAIGAARVAGGGDHGWCRALVDASAPSSCPS